MRAHFRSRFDAMQEPETAISALRPTDFARVLAARDARFDGLFFVGITTTRVYCRPVCPARVTHQDRRRFFDSAAAAERAGFRPCMRCRPELAPGRTAIEAVSRLAREAVDRIGAGALNGRSVAQLAADLGVSERHLRRALEREMGVSPIALAQTHRLLLAKRLLVDTTLSVTQIAYASGFQSLRRFNATFRQQYRMAPTALRRRRRASGRPTVSESMLPDAIKLSLAYRPPLAWKDLLDVLRCDAVPGVESVSEERYTRAACVEGATGLVAVEQAAGPPKGKQERPTSLNVWLSQSLVPVVMPLLARLRRLFDLDAEPAVVDAHLAQGGLGDLVQLRPGLRVAGSLGGFEVAFRTLLMGAASGVCPESVRHVVRALGSPVTIGDESLTHCVPSARQVLSAGEARLRDCGIPQGTAACLVAIARAVVDGTLRLERGSDPEATQRFLMSLHGMTEAVAATIVMRALAWPDAFPASDCRLQRALGVAGADELRAAAEHWRPWRAYAAQHLWLTPIARLELVKPHVA